MPDYEYEDTELYRHFKILEGKYVGIEYYYANTHFVEQGEGGIVQFHVQFINAGAYDPDLLIKDQDFVNIIGDIFLDVISKELKGRS